MECIYTHVNTKYQRSVLEQVYDKESLELEINLDDYNFKLG